MSTTQIVESLTIDFTGVPPEERPRPLDVLAELEPLVLEGKPRGTCSRCGYQVLLTPRGYLKSHCYFMERGERAGLFSWQAIRDRKDGDPPRAIIRCSGGGNRPKKEPTGD